MGNRLDNKVAVLTAAGAGIGLATARAFAREGARVWATDIDADALQQLSQMTTVMLDVRDGNGIEKFASEVGPIDILFNCAGYVHNGDILNCDEPAWELSFDINVKSMYRMIRAFLPGMVAQRRGSIINVASVASSLRGVPNRFAYTATKAAVVGMTKAIAADFVQQGIRCNAVCPGTIDTPSLQARLQSFDDPAQARIDFEQRQPMGRLGSADEVAAAAVYLASEESGFTTGTLLPVDGGWCNQ